MDETFHITLNDIVNVHMGNEHIEYNENLMMSFWEKRYSIILLTVIVINGEKG